MNLLVRPLIVALALMAAALPALAQGVTGGSSGGGGGVVTQPTGSLLHMDCDNCSATSGPADESAITFGTTPQAPIGGVYQTTATSNPLTTGQLGIAQMTINRAIHMNLRDAAGVALGVAAAPLQVSLANTTVNGTPIAVTLPANTAFNVAQINGVTALMGNGVTGTGSQRVTIASDNTPFTVNATVSGSLTNISGTVSLPTGAATSALQTTANTSLATIASNTGAAIPVGTNSIGAVSQTNGDPCSSVAHVFTPINISSAANTKIVTGTSSKKTYICHLFLFAAAADNVGIVEGSGTNCGTSALGLIGGNTAATGINLAANQGFESGHSTNAIAATTVNANDFCLITSAGSQLSGVAVTVAN